MTDESVIIPVTTWSGVLEALQPITHGGQVLGIRSMFRTTPHLGADGRQIEIPNVSGGNVRAVIRKTAAALFLEALGSPRLPYDQVTALRRGGVIKPISKREDVLNAEKQAHVRDLVLPLAVFGGTGGGRIMSGSLTVDSAVPVVAELSHRAQYYPPVPLNYSWPSVHDVMFNSDHSRVPDVVFESTLTDTLEETRRRTRTHGTKSADPSIDGKQRYSYRSMVPGTLLWHEVTLEQATPLMWSFTRDVIAHWGRRARIGGRHGKGYGRVIPTYTVTTTNLWGDPIAEPDYVDWRSWAADNRDAILDVMTWL